MIIKFYRIFKIIFYPMSKFHMIIDKINKFKFKNISTSQKLPNSQINKNMIL